MRPNHTSARPCTTPTIAPVKASVKTRIEAVARPKPSPSARCAWHLYEGAAGLTRESPHGSPDGAASSWFTLYSDSVPYPSCVLGRGTRAWVPGARRARGSERGVARSQRRCRARLA